jgi:hypothetical protein
MSRGLTAATLLGALALGCTAARAADPPPPAGEPDPHFLEFLGSVDRLAEVNPDYISQAEARAGKPPGGTPTGSTPPPPPPPPPPPQQPPTAANLPGAPNNE